MKNSQRAVLRYWRLLAWVFFVGVLSYYLLESFNKNLKIETNIIKLLPNTESEPATDLAFERFAEKNMEQLIFLLSSESESILEVAAENLTKSMSKSKWILSVNAKTDKNQQEKMGALFFQYRHHLLGDSERAYLLRKDYQSFSDEALQLIYSPISTGLVNLVKTDPFFLSYRFLQNLNLSDSLELKNGYVTTFKDNKHYILITAKLNTSPFAQRVQEDILEQINVFEKRWLNEGTADVVQLYKTGAIFYADYAFKTAKKEISTIGLGSLLLVITLVLFAFRSLSPLILTSLTLALGVLTGLVCVLTIFGEIHLITLVFGASLIGVAVDYCFHYFAADDVKGGNSRLTQILPAISLGLSSSIVGYLALATTPFPGLQQMAVFCIAGLTGAFITVCLFFPAIKIKVSLSNNLLLLCQNILSNISPKKSIALWSYLWILPLLAFLLMNKEVLLSIQEGINPDNIRQFQSVGKELKEQENKIKNILSSVESNQFYLVKGKDTQSLLENIELAKLELGRLVERKVIRGYIAISDFIPSIRLQNKNYRLLSELYRSSALNDYSDYKLLSENDINTIRMTFSKSNEQFLLPDIWLASTQGKSLSNLWLGEIEGDYYAIIPIKGINDVNSLKNISDNILFIDKVGKISGIFTQYRQQSTKLLLVALIVIGLMLSFRYGLKKSIFIISSPIFSISFTVVMLSVFSVPLTLFNTLALFLVVGIGVDYGLFFAESKEMKASTLLAIMLSALTTLFSFGLLALSETTAIYSFGLTMLFGISASFLLSPLIGSLVIQNSNKKNRNY